ncbi:hypothetical protein A2U01_0107695, partial [Trifolium medium]|nr:hypothetical protein [Trifolium medium]
MVRGCPSPTRQKAKEMTVILAREAELSACQRVVGTCRIYLHALWNPLA